MAVLGSGKGSTSKMGTETPICHRQVVASGVGSAGFEQLGGKAHTCYCRVLNDHNTVVMEILTRICTGG